MSTETGQTHPQPKATELRLAWKREFVSVSQLGGPVFRVDRWKAQDRNLRSSLRTASPRRPAMFVVTRGKCSVQLMKSKLRQANKEHNVSSVPSAVELLRQFLDTFLAKDMKGLSLLCADEIVTEFPFAPEGSPRRLEGREAFYEYLRNYPSVIDVRSIPQLRIYSTDDPNVAIAEWSSSGEVLTNGNAYAMSYATFVTVRDGLIVNYREYWNPLAFMQAMDGATF
jgi:hypothetical protein